MSEQRPRLLIVHPTLDRVGGTFAVASWFLQALRAKYELLLVTWCAPDLELVNRSFGTDLGPLDFRLHLPPEALRRAIDRLPTRAALLRSAILIRYAKELIRRLGVDLVISTNNEADFGHPTIQYIHYPARSTARPETERRWYHALPRALDGYRVLCERVAGTTLEGIRRNVTLTNSRWTANRIRELYALDAALVFPPVADFRDARPWSERSNAFLCLGRISPEKELEKVVTIIAGVRARGHQVGLTLVGSPADADYLTRIRALARRNAAWMRLELGLSQDAMSKLIRTHRYGIHGMVQEHFGMAVAEIQSAGCPIFVPNDGGPPEIVGFESALMYTSPADAVEKISRVLGDSELQSRLHVQALDRAASFSTERFGAEVRGVVATALEARRVTS